MKDTTSSTYTLIAIALAGGFILGTVVFSNRSVADSQLPDTKTNEDLKAEIAILVADIAELRNFMSGLRESHNALVEGHNDLQDDVTSLSGNMVVLGSALDKQVKGLEDTLSMVCRWVFTGFSTNCPSSSIGLSNRNLESRIEQLERGY